MLILTRHIGESLVINDDIQIAILGWRYSAVKLGVAAPKDIPIHRRELWDRIQSGKRFEERLILDDPFSDYLKGQQEYENRDRG